MKKKLAIFISGRGSNLKAILDFERSRECHFQSVLVVSDQKDAQGIAIAKQFNIPVLSYDVGEFESREQSEEHIHHQLIASGVELVVLAGYMKLLTPWFMKCWKGKVINIHPSLLPRFPGLNAQKQALEAGEKKSGCTVFWVDEGMDSGRIISQVSVPVHDSDTETDLSRRILKEEHQLLPSVIEKIASKKINFSDR